MPVRPGVTDCFNVFLGKCYMKVLLVFFLVFLNPRLYFQNPYFCEINSYFPILRGLFISVFRRHSQCYMKRLSIFGDLNPRLYFQNPYFCKINSYFPIFRGSFISVCIGGIPNAIRKCLVFLETWTPVFTSRIPISAKLILIFRYLGGNLYPFASEASQMLYENAWYFWRLEPPFLLPKSLFLRN